jgi:hypothetical protein
MHIIILQEFISSKICSIPPQKDPRIFKKKMVQMDVRF